METGDENGSAPSEQGTSIGGYFKSVRDTYSTFPYYESSTLYETYSYGWGILDAYEFWQYFQQNY